MDKIVKDSLEFIRIMNEDDVTDKKKQIRKIAYLESLKGEKNSDEARALWVIDTIGELTPEQKRIQQDQLKRAREIAGLVDKAKKIIKESMADRKNQLIKNVLNDLEIKERMTLPEDFKVFMENNADRLYDWAFSEIKVGSNLIIFNNFLGATGELNTDLYKWYKFSVLDKNYLIFGNGSFGESFAIRTSGDQLGQVVVFFDDENGELIKHNLTNNFSDFIRRLHASAIGKKKQSGEKINESADNTLIKGGKADHLSIEEIAKKHNISIEKIEAQIKKGIPVEAEHVGKDVARAREICMDHLSEFPDYYNRLGKMEAQAKQSLGVERQITTGPQVGLVEAIELNRQTLANNLKDIRIDYAKGIVDSIKLYSDLMPKAKFMYGMGNLAEQLEQHIAEDTLELEKAMDILEKDGKEYILNYQKEVSKKKEEERVIDLSPELTKTEQKSLDGEKSVDEKNEFDADRDNTLGTSDLVSKYMERG